LPFVDHPWFLEKVWGKTGGKIYGPETREDYQDNELRFSLLCQAAIDAPRILNLSSSEHLVDLMGKMLSSWPMIGIQFFFLVT